MLKKGNYVVYTPFKGCDKKDKEYGGVSRDQEPGNTTVFVKYDNSVMKMYTADEEYTGKSTRIEDLEFISEKRPR